MLGFWGGCQSQLQIKSCIFISRKIYLFMPLFQSFHWLWMHFNFYCLRKCDYFIKILCDNCGFSSLPSYFIEVYFVIIVAILCRNIKQIPGNGDSNFKRSSKIWQCYTVSIPTLHEWQCYLLTLFPDACICTNVCFKGFYGICMIYFVALAVR